MRQALDETKANRVGHAEENQWNRRSGGVDRDRGIARRGDQNLWTKRDQLSQERRYLLITALIPTILDLNVLPLDIAVCAQSLLPRLHQLGVSYAPEIPDAMNRRLSPGLRRN